MNEFTNDTVEEILRSFDDKEDVDMTFVTKGTSYLKIITGTSNNTWFALSLCTCTKASGKIRKIKDDKLIYSPMKNYQISNTEYSFQAGKQYDLVSLYEIPKEFFPEYFL